jgi:hypothetical protein
MAKKDEELSASFIGPDGEEHDVTEIMFPQGEGVQLSLEVEPHPAIDVVHGKGFIAGTLRVAGELPVTRDLNVGDRLTVQIADADGQVLTSGELELMDPPAFKTVRHKDLGPVGIERKHTAFVDLDA